MTLPLLPNAVARRIFLDRHALAEAPTGPAKALALADLIDRIGFVQVDSINTVERAHHMILWSRRQSYQPAALKRLIEQDRAVWEHWTHDASILPVGVYGHWKHRFDHDRPRLVERWTGWQRQGFHEKFDEVLARVQDYGPVTSADVGEGEQRGKGGWWDWHPSKAALEYLWRVGELAVTRRDGFRKVYDLTGRVIPLENRTTVHSAEETVEWACTTALNRLGFASATEISAFWALISPKAARNWCDSALAQGRLVEAEIEGANAPPKKAFLWPETLGETPPAPSTRLRILSPFDPALRDRKRSEHLFGFRYRIEVFVPEPKRIFGYYVFPVLEGARLIGRIDTKAFRNARILRVTAFWPEAGQGLTSQRRQKLQAELDRLARFSGCENVEYLPGWERSAIVDPHP